MDGSPNESCDVMSDPWLIIGLGNPGRKYTQSRHNLGFRVVERLADKFGLDWRRGRGKTKVATGSILKGDFVVLAKPQTFMNLSGAAVVQLLNFYKIDPSALLIICDDINLPFGRIRLRGQGSDGGHKGLASIIQCLRTRNFARLRIGIGSDYSHGKMTKHVLGKFPKEEMEELDYIITTAAEAARCFICEGLEEAMNTYNRVISNDA